MSKPHKNTTTSLEGRIIKGVAGSYVISTAEGEFTCNPRGVFRNRNMTPLVGDLVAITPNQSASTANRAGKIGTLHTIHPRRNTLRRPPMANIDQVIITVATAQPAFNAGLLDRFLVLIAYEDIPVVICVNKIDLNEPTASASEFEPYRMAGYPIIYTSAKPAEASVSNILPDPAEINGLADLRKVMHGRLNILAGPSGVGKSSLINALSPSLSLETGDLSVKLGRGKHTTRHSEIFQLGETPEAGYCADTPGFTSLETTHIPKEALGRLFREFLPHISDCKFNNCLHHKEINCGVKAEVGTSIHPARYESYVKILMNA